MNTGSLPVTPEIEAELQEACQAVAEMRDDLPLFDERFAMRRELYISLPW
ncbi:MAG: hypothetical protein AAF965_05685 [Pseudomonadota bacterium]